MSLLCFWALNMSVALVSMEGQKALGFHQIFLNLCSEDEWRSYGFGTIWDWVINDRKLIFRLTSLLRLLVAFAIFFVISHVCYKSYLEKGQQTLSGSSVIHDSAYSVVIFLFRIKEEASVQRDADKVSVCMSQWVFTKPCQTSLLSAYLSRATHPGIVLQRILPLKLELYLVFSFFLLLQLVVVLQKSLFQFADLCVWSLWKQLGLLQLLLLLIQRGA